MGPVTNSVTQGGVRTDVNLGTRGKAADKVITCQINGYYQMIWGNSIIKLVLYNKVVYCYRYAIPKSLT